MRRRVAQIAILTQIIHENVKGWRGKLQGGFLSLTGKVNSIIQCAA